jgi:tetratricopeptide (TPR) repeat protein
MARFEYIYGGRYVGGDSYALSEFIVERDNGTGLRCFFVEQEREARDYYNSLQALDNQEKLIKIQQENLEANKNANNPKFGINSNIYQRPPTPPLYHDPEYIEFQKWKKENDPEYIKFKQEKARKAAEEDRRRLIEKAQKQKEQEQKAIVEAKKLLQKAKKQIQSKSLTNAQGKIAEIEESLRKWREQQDNLNYWDMEIAKYASYWAYSGKAGALERLGRYNEALRYYERAKKLENRWVNKTDEYDGSETMGLSDKYFEADRKIKKLRKKMGLPETEKSGCYIASTCYGSCDCKQVLTFRNFRDEYLSQTLAGRIFINTYYALSPNFAKWLESKYRINTFIREKFLDRMYKLLKDKY